MRSLIFGGEGMLGRALVAAARRRGHAALALSRAAADVTDPDRLAYWVERWRPELVVNCAAFTQVDACEERRDHAFAVNGAAVAHVAAAAEQVGARLVHVSTDYVFDGTADEPYREEAATAPRSVYGESKLAGEALALAYDGALVVRASWLFGPGGPNFAATMLRLLAEGQAPLRVVHDQVGSPTYTPYLAAALLDLAAAGATGLVHYRNREAVSWHGFASAIARRVAPQVEVVPVSTEEFPRPAPRPAYSVLDVGRCERLLGRPVERWETGLDDYLERRQRGTA
jgi:dTDP-4-dehydrorhamnose reductase